MVQYRNLDRIIDAGDHFKNGVILKTHISKRNHNRTSMPINTLLILFILNVFLFSSCEINEMDSNSVIHDYMVQNILYAKDSKLKNISYVESVKSKKGGIIITQYDYDERGRISKESQPMYKVMTLK
jgi:hypothetical protein